MDRPTAMEAVALLLAHYPLQADRVPEASQLLMVKEFEEGCETREDAADAVRTCSEWYENVPSVASVRRAIRYVPSLAPTVNSQRVLTADEQQKSEEAAREVFQAWREKRRREHGGQRDAAVDGDAGPDEEGAGRSPDGGGAPTRPEPGIGGEIARGDGDPGSGGAGARRDSPGIGAVPGE